ncbi:MAG TPA: tetratricopeptide repeat protein [Armatimonadota bacterium]
MFEDAHNSDREEQLSTLLQAGKLDEALELLQGWHEHEPWNGEVLMRMAVVHWQAGEPAHTLRDLDAYLEGDPENAEVLARRAQALLMLGKREDAELSLRRAEALDPMTPGVLLNRALVLEERGEYTTAIVSLSAYLEAAPTDHLALARRSHLFRQLGLLQQALADAQSCVRMHPEDPEAHFAEALAQVTLEQGEDALAACAASLLAQPTFLPALRLRIDLLADLHRLDEADRDLAQLIAVDAETPQTSLLRARLAAEHDDFPTALLWMRQFLNDAPDAEHGYYRRGMIYFRMGDFTHALEDFLEYTRYVPTAVEGFEQQFMCYLELNRVAEAVAVGETAVALQPENYRVQYNLAFAQLLRGELASAHAGFRTALALHPQDEDLLLRIYLAFVEQAASEDRLIFLRDTVVAQAQPTVMLRGLLAETSLELGHPEDAWSLAQGILHDAPDRAFGYLLGIKALCVLERYPEALAVADAAIAVLPDDGQLRLARSLVLRDMGLSDDALQELAQAEQLLPDEPEVLRQRALVFGTMGKIADAVRLLQQTVALDAGNTDGYFWLGYFLIHRRRHRDALAAAERLLALTPNSAEGHVVRSAALRGLRRHTEANESLWLVQQDNPQLLARLRTDPVMDKLLAPVAQRHIIETTRETLSRCWQGFRRTLRYGSS